MRRLSIVITNHDYELYIRAAVDSALSIEWSDVEVVVVDDGSTDGSVEILKQYGDRIKLRAQENAGQREAVNSGFAMSTGDVVIFLDSDDVLPPQLARVVHGAMLVGVSKVQVQAQRIDERGAVIGMPFPKFQPVPSAANLRQWMVATSAYPTPPGSANAYARWFLDRLMPLPDLGDQAADSALLAAAPLVGDVASVRGVSVGYRRHDANDSNLLVDPTRFAREVRRARVRWRSGLAAAGLPVTDRALRRSRELLQLRAAALRVAPAEPALLGESRRRLLADALRSPFHVGPESLVRRATVAGWVLAVIVSPSGLSRHLIRMRYARAQ